MQITGAMPLLRLCRMSPARRRLIVRAAVALTAASAAVALLPFRWAVRFGSRRIRGQTALMPSECAWAVEAAARRLPWRTMCIEKGLAVQRLLRSGGVNAVLHYGARQNKIDGKLEAHVWVSVATETIIGGDQAADFAELASYP